MELLLRRGVYTVRKLEKYLLYTSDEKVENPLPVLTALLYISTGLEPTGKFGRNVEGEKEDNYCTGFFDAFRTNLSLLHSDIICKYL
jgi:hypothetical protein